MPIFLIIWGALATIVTTILFFITDLRLLTCYLLGGLCAGLVVVTAAGVCTYLGRQDERKSPCHPARRR